MNKMSHKITLVYRIKDRIDMGFRIHIYSILFYPLFSLFFWRCLDQLVVFKTDSYSRYFKTCLCESDKLIFLYV